MPGEKTDFAIGEKISGQGTNELLDALRTELLQKTEPADQQHVIIDSGTVSVTEPVSVDDNGGSLTVDAPIATPVNVQISDGTRTATVRDTGTSDSLNVAIVDAAGNQVTSFGGGTQFADGAARGTATGTLAMGDDGTNIQSVHVDTAGDLQIDVLTLPSISGTVTANQGTPASTANRWPVQITDGTDLALVTAAGAVVVDGSGVTQPVSIAATVQVDVTDEATRDLGKVDIASLDQYTPVSGRLPVDPSGVTSPVSLASTTLTATVYPAGEDSVVDGRQTVATAGTSVQLSAQACKAVAITAETDNTGIIVVGASTVVAAIATRRGIPLSAGDTVVFGVDNMNRLFMDSTVSGDGITWVTLA